MPAKEKMSRPKTEKTEALKPNATLELVRRLTQATGPSGYETRAARVALAELKPFADQVKIDKMGSVAAFKKGTGPKPSGKKILLAAHLDEIGLLINRIEEGGFLRFTEIGGFDIRVLLGQEVLVHPVGRLGPGTDKSFPGIIGAKPPHFQTPEESRQVIDLADLYIDLGMPEKEVRAKVSVGDVATMKMPFITLKNDRAAGKAMDDRACVAVMVKTLELLQKSRHNWDVYAVATVQEEDGWGCLGALTSCYKVDPDIGIALDVTHADMPMASDSETAPLGKGPTISVGPNLHPAVVEKLKDVAKAEEIPYQLEPVAGTTGTDAVDIQISREGIPTGLIGLPLRYMHTPVEMVAAIDVERSARLLARFITELDDIKLEWKDED
jgi:putative aminopeptidase FrvX